NIVAKVRLVGRGELVVHHPAVGMAVAVAIVLQLALAGLVAYRTIERVIEEQALERLGLGRLGSRAIGDDDGVVESGRLAGRYDLGWDDHLAIGLAFADLDETHPATGHHGESGVPAVMGDEHPGALSGLDEVELVAADIYRLAVDVDDGHDALAVLYWPALGNWLNSAADTSLTVVQLAIRTKRLPALVSRS